MTYGIRFDDVSSVRTPIVEEYDWGTRVLCTTRTEYGLERITIRPHGTVPSRYWPRRHSVYFVETGQAKAVLRDRHGTPTLSALRTGAVMPIAAGFLHGFSGSATETVLYYFCDNPADECRNAETQAEAEQTWRTLSGQPILEASLRTHDVRDKYWGTIETIVNQEFAGKRLFMRAGCQSSLEFHTRKTETYFVHCGELRVGLRTDRARNRSVRIAAGQCIDIPAGLMHMRIAVEDTVILEASTHDSDVDSHLVEDGRTYTHRERPASPVPINAQSS